MVNNYWVDESYIKALESYSTYNKMCLSLNIFNREDNWAFEKRKYYAKIMDDIKNRYKKAV